MTTVEPGQDIGQAIRLMVSKRIGGLPVVREGELVGIITESDVVQGLVCLKLFVLQQLFFYQLRQLYLDEIAFHFQVVLSNL